MKKKVAVCISSYGIVNSPSLLNLINFLHKTYDLTLILDKVADIDFYFCKNRYNSVRMSKLKIFNFLFKKKYDQQHLIVAVDPSGYCLALDMFKKEIPKLYYCLELHLNNDHAALTYPYSIRKKERKKINQISGLLIQSEERKRIFISDYGLDHKLNSFLLPVTYEGKAVTKRDEFLHEAFFIPRDKKILLHLGGIGEWFSSLKFVDIFSKVQGWALVFHGEYDSKYKKKIDEYIRVNKITNVYISNFYGPSTDLMDKILASSDAGLAWYNDNSKNFSTAGESSGKISAYLRYGLPIISKKYPSTKRVIEKNKCGVCISEESQLIFALEKVNDRHTLFRENCHKLYNKRYNFSLYRPKLKVFFNKLIT